MTSNFHNQALLSGIGLLWEFANRIYSKPEIESLSLELQDQYGANVNILLWACWLESEEIKIPQVCLNDVVQIIDDVSHETVDKLREVRRALKNSNYFTKVQALGIKKHILNAELVVEKVLLQRLQDLTCRFLETTSVGPDEVALDLSCYLQKLNVPEAEEKTRVYLSACLGELSAVV